MTRRADANSRGFFAIGIEHNKCAANIGTLWRSAMSYDAAFVFTVGRRYQQQSSDTTVTWRHIPLFAFETLDDLIQHLPYSCPLVGVEIGCGAKPIAAYHHRERAAYLLGAEDRGLSADALSRCHELVELPGRFCLNVSVAGSLVMFDRHQKRTHDRLLKESA